MLDKSAYTLVWAEDGLRPHPERRFTTQYPDGVQVGYGSHTSRTRAGAHEAQLYVDPAYQGQLNADGRTGYRPPALGLNPFFSGDGAVSIIADHMPPALVGAPAGAGLPDLLKYSSGLLTTYRRFAMTYGLVETDLQFSGGCGGWPAGWLYPLDGAGPYELDVVELLGHDPTTGVFTAHGGTPAKPVQAAFTVRNLPDPTQGMVTYAMEVTAAGVRWFVNGAPVAQAGPEWVQPRPMYLLHNLAIGGPNSWPGPPDASTPFPMVMRFRSRAYSLP